MNAPQQPFKRKHFFINKKLQGKFTVYFLVLGLIITVGTVAAIWYYLQEQIESIIYSTHLSITSPWKAIFPVLIKVLAASTLLLTVSTFVTTFFIFKRLESKLKSFNAALVNLSKGDLSVSAPSDGLRDLNEPLNQFIGKIKSDIGSMQNIQADMKKVAANPGSGNLDELNASLKKKLSGWQFKTD